MAHKYTPEQAVFIKENVTGSSRKELTYMFNACFGLELGVNQITAYLKNHNLKNGLDSKFEPGHIPANKGKSVGGWEPTQFKKGNKPWNYQPVGSERINADGYVDIKVADPNKWKAKHILVWEAANGPVPQGHVVIFGDGNKLNLDLNNLILASRKQLVMLNKHKLIQNDAELTRTGIIVADIYCKIGERKKTKSRGSYLG